MYSQNVDQERAKAQPWTLVRCEGMKRRGKKEQKTGVNIEEFGAESAGGV